MDGAGGQVQGGLRWWATVLSVIVLGVGVLGLYQRASQYAQALAAVPTPGFEASVTPLGSPAVVPFPRDTHRFMTLQADGRTPVAWDPCRPVHFVVRPDGAPANGPQLLAEAVARVSAVTGLRFVDDGETDEAPSGDRADYQPDRYGDRWAPVLVAWQTGLENPRFVSEAWGLAGPVAAAVPGGPLVYVSGQVMLDADHLSRLAAEPGGAAVVRGVILHELGHVVGLHHVDDPAELMFAGANPRITQYGPGDLTGLAELGRGTCEPRL